MLLNLTIAWRNIFRHKGKSIVIGCILFLGALIMTVGNGVITGMNNGLQKHIVDEFIGDLVLISLEQKNDTVVFNMMAESIEVISDYPQIKEFLKQQNYLEKFLPVAVGAPIVLNEEEGEPDFNFIIGVDFEEYRKMFPGNMKIIEGRYPNPGERGMLLTNINREMNYKYLLGYWISPEGVKLVTKNLVAEAKEQGDNLKVYNRMIFMGYSDKNTTLDILAPVKGIIKYNALNKFIGFFNLVDIESFRECFGYVSAEDSAAEVAQETKDILGLDSTNLDDIFSSEDIFSETTEENFDYDITTLKRETKKTKNINYDSGSYNQVFIKLKDGIELEEGQKMLNEAAKKSNLPVRVVTWKQAMGEVADLALLMKGALFIFVMFIFFVAIIIIMNTLSMAALERIPEIGMMRAVGAKKSFISKMFFHETAMLSFAFGGAGIVTGFITVQILNLLNLTTTNEMLELFYGGDKFQPYLGTVDISLAIIQLVIVTLLATIYPILVARRITPLDAISRD